ncbi:MAG: hypothetical protein JXB05_36305 [Myxococcaceae bacterium]|nr:hypothetical protein [Myxococcaceae bacterium]
MPPTSLARAVALALDQEGHVPPALLESAWETCDGTLASFLTVLQELWRVEQTRLLLTAARVVGLPPITFEPLPEVPGAPRLPYHELRRGGSLLALFQRQLPEDTARRHRLVPFHSADYRSLELAVVEPLSPEALGSVQQGTRLALRQHLLLPDQLAPAQQWVYTTPAQPPGYAAPLGVRTLRLESGSLPSRMEMEARVRAEVDSGRTPPGNILRSLRNGWDPGWLEDRPEFRDRVAEIIREGLAARAYVLFRKGEVHYDEEASVVLYGWLDAAGALQLAVARHPFRHDRLPLSEAELWQHAFDEVLTADVCTGEAPVTVIYNPRTRRHFVFEALRHKQRVFGM